MKTKIDVWVEEKFVEALDRVAKVTGNTRSGLIREALRHYLRGEL